MTTTLPAPVPDTLPLPAPTAPTPAERAVARGAALLDDRMPGWADLIDLPNLELRSTCNCVLGQLFPATPNGLTGYDVGIVDLDLEDSERYGFDLTPSTPYEFAQLDTAWTAAILARRTTGGAR